MPDPVLAKKARLSLSTVAKERRRRGIPPCQRKRPAIEWTPEMVAVLGTDSDPNVGAMLRIPPWSVRRKRTLLGIPPYTPPPAGANPGHDWSPREIALLGTMPDQKLADRLGIGVGAVAHKRQVLHISPAKPKPRPIRWTKTMLSLLGEHPDSEVGRRYGISTSRVKLKRRALGIAAHTDQRAVVRTPELIALLRLPSTVVRQRTGLKWDTIRQLRHEYGIEAPTYFEVRWPPEVIARLGTVPDAEIARERGISCHRVSSKRRSLGIPPPQRAWQRWRPHDLALLGTLPDEEVAARLGRSVANVRAKRQELERRRRQGRKAAR
jgi:hypothetical protein